MMSRSGWHSIFLAAILPMMAGVLMPAQSLSNSVLYRPAFHYSPEKNWINDPTGLVYDGFTYHLFNQYNPQGDQWGHMSWSHAVSKDLLHWKPMPVALREENGIMIFTGSAVLDAKNSSGFGKDGVAPLVAIYTGDSKNLQTENLAYSTDHGTTWTKYAGNPVLDLHEKDFRDPQVFWYAPGKYWVMVVSLATQHKLLIYSSPDLKSWTKMSEFGPAGIKDVPNWECPNLFPLPVANVPGATKWVLELGVGNHGPAGGSATEYFVGDFDGVRFLNENPAGQALWVDYGADFYAMQTFTSASSDGRRVGIAWMDNWDYAGKLPTTPFQGQNTIPRTLGLLQTPEGTRLTQRPVQEVKSLRGAHQQLRNASWEDLRKLLTGRDWSQTLEIEASFQTEKDSAFGLILRQGENYGVKAGFDNVKGVLYVDRTAAGELPIAPTFARRHEAPMKAEKGEVKMHILLDRSSVELFGNDGLAVLTDLIFPRAQDRGIEIFATGNPPHGISFDIWTLKTR
jgi:fructan beta-fructosidase